MRNPFKEEIVQSHFGGSELLHLLKNVMIPIK